MKKKILISVLLIVIILSFSISVLAYECSGCAGHDFTAECGSTYGGYTDTHTYTIYGVPYSCNYDKALNNTVLVCNDCQTPNWFGFVHNEYWIHHRSCGINYNTSGNLCPY